MTRLASIDDMVLMYIRCREVKGLRNILITVMFIIVVCLMFTSMITDDTTGIKAKIVDKGTTANTQISGLDIN